MNDFGFEEETPLEIGDEILLMFQSRPYLLMYYEKAS